MSEFHPPEPYKCGCGKGYASFHDGMCCFCRAKQLPGSVAKRHHIKKSDGVSYEKYRAITGGR